MKAENIYKINELDEHEKEFALEQIEDVLKEKFRKEELPKYTYAIKMFEIMFNVKINDYDIDDYCINYDFEIQDKCTDIINDEPHLLSFVLMNYYPTYKRIMAEDTTEELLTIVEPMERFMFGNWYCTSYYEIIEKCIVELLNDLKSKIDDYTTEPKCLQYGRHLEFFADGFLRNN